MSKVCYKKVALIFLGIVIISSTSYYYMVISEAINNSLSVGPDYGDKRPRSYELTDELLNADQTITTDDAVRLAGEWIKVHSTTFRGRSDGELEFKRVEEPERGMYKIFFSFQVKCDDYGDLQENEECYGEEIKREAVVRMIYNYFLSSTLDDVYLESEIMTVEEFEKLHGVSLDERHYEYYETFKSVGFVEEHLLEDIYEDEETGGIVYVWKINESVFRFLNYVYYDESLKQDVFVNIDLDTKEVYYKGIYSEKEDEETGEIIKIYENLENGEVLEVREYEDEETGGVIFYHLNIEGGVAGKVLTYQDKETGKWIRKEL